jgi:hypothetical protein
MLPDIVGIGLLDVEQVFILYVLFIRPVPFPDIFLELVHRGMQVNEQVRLYHLLVDDFKQALVEPEFIVRKVHFGKKEAFGEQVVRNGQGLEKVFLMEKILLLLIPFGHEKEFQGKGILGRILIKLGEEWIVGKLLQDQAGVEMARQQMGQRGFSCSDIAFNGNEVIVHTVDQT